MKESAPSARSYVATFLGLMAFLAATVVAGYIDFGVMNLPIALAISIAKTLLIVLFFMHLPESGRLTWLLAGAGFVWLLILLVLAMTDYATRHWQEIYSVLPRGWG